MLSDYEVRELFSDKEFIGTILRLSSLLEMSLDCALAQYFVRDDRIQEGLDLILSEMTFSKKIEILAKLPIRRNIVSHKKAIVRLRRFRRIRNIAAHSWALSISETRKLLNNSEYKAILRDYPNGTKREFQSARDSLHRLLRTKEFLNSNLEKSLDPYILNFEKMF